MKTRLLITAVLALSFSVVPANAATMTVTLAKSSGITNEEKVGVTLTNFPTRAGIYLQQCVEPAAGARPTACNRATQLWVTNQPGGSARPTDPIAITLVTAFDGHDCLAKKCGVFARLDHTAGQDTSEDLFIPVTFTAGAAPSPVAAVAPPVAQALAKFPARARVGANVALPLQTDRGLAVTYRTASPRICQVKNNVLTATRMGSCRVQAYAPAGANVAMFAKNLTIAIVKR